ncbi:16006_t:CDS:2, partial [Cetraspora pellucida]
STTRASKAVDLVSSDESETDSLVSSDYDTQEDDYFQDNDDDNGVNLVIKQLLAASAVSFKKRSRSAVYVGNSKRTKQRKNKTLREAAGKNDNEDDNKDNNEDDNEGMTEKEKKIANAIEFVNKVIREEKLSEAKKACYTATLYFLRLLFNGKKKIKASEAVAEVIGGGPWFAKCIRKWANICMKGELIQHCHGKFSSKSLLNDELVSLKLAAYLRSQKFQINPIMVKNYVEQQIIPQLDVVAYRQVFLQKVSEYEQLMSKWYDEDCKIRTYPLLADGEKEHIWVTHDKSTFHVNDGPRAMWGSEKEQPLRKKEIGLGIHVSDFLTEMIGPLRDDLEEARAMIVLGSHHDGYWDAKKLIIQVRQAIDIFKRTHPGCVVLKMQDTVWNGNCKSMVIEEDYIIYDNKTKSNINLRGQPKGLKWVLDKRGLWQEGMILECASCKKEPNPNITNCCACRLMANQPDFLAQCGQVQQEIKSCSHKGAAKKYTRDNCKYSFLMLRQTIIEAFNSISLEQICSFAKLLFRWMDAYQHGLMGKAAEYA